MSFIDVIITFGNYNADEKTGILTCNKCGQKYRDDYSHDHRFGKLMAATCIVKHIHNEHFPQISDDHVEKYLEIISKSINSQEQTEKITETLEKNMTTLTQQVARVGDLISALIMYNGKDVENDGKGL